MFDVSFEVEGVSDLMFGQAVRTPKQDNETHEQHEERTWQEKVRLTKEGQCYLNPFAVTNSLVSAGEWLKRKVPGEQRATFTKRFRQGVRPGGNVLLFKKDGTPCTMEDIEPIPLFVPSDGKHGGAKRVIRIFPTLHEWVAKGSLYVFDGKITEEVFRDHLICVGQYVGWGAMRVANQGINGAFSVIKILYRALEAVA